jgi:hypothetical protein
MPAAASSYSPVPTREVHVKTALVRGAVVVGVLDLLDAFLFFGRYGVSRVRILQSIAAGLLGRSAYDGGSAMAALGLLLHFFIAFCIVGVFFLLARAVPALIRRPYLAGPLYGLAAYFVMNGVVLPLSATPPGSFPNGPVLVNGLLIHAFGVGLPAALFARTAFSGRPEPTPRQ